jgi:hypothetical protein
MSLLAVVAALVAVPTAAAADTPSITCAGGQIAGGTYSSVTVSGLCAVAGDVTVMHGLTVASGGVLDAAGATTGNCSLVVDVNGGVDVQSGGVLFLGESQGTGCPSDSNGLVTGGIQAAGASTVVVHGTYVSGGIRVTGGGGGTTCNDVTVDGIDIGPPYTDVEDSHVSGGVAITALSTCWLGFIRNTVSGTVTLAHNTVGDPDAIEVGLNAIRGTLACSGNQLAFPGPGGVPTNSFDNSPPNPNVVTGAETGQCAGL